MRLLVVVLLFFLSACAAAPAPREPAHASVPALRAVVHGADGRPLGDAPWKLLRWSMNAPIKTGRLAADGSFGAELPAGAYLVVFGEGEVERVFTAYVDRPVGVDVTLAKDPSSDVYAWSGVDAVASALQAFDQKWRKETRRVVAAAPKGKDGRPELDASAKAELAGQAHVARGEAANGLLRAGHLAIFWPYLDDETRRADAIWVTQNVKPDEPRLALVMDLDFAMSRSAPRSAEVEAWFERIAATNSEPGFACDAIAFVAWQAEERNDQARLHTMYERSQAPRCAGTFGATALKKTHDPARLLQVGKPFPAFDFAAVEEGAPHVTKDSRLGHPYLIEFWATWCSPCVKVMPKLHEIYPRVKAKYPKLELVFVAVETSPDTLATFRKNFPMPWTNALTPESLDTLSDRYGLVGVPTLVLVDEKGTILEVGKKLYPDELEATLERTLR